MAIDFLAATVFVTLALATLLLRLVSGWRAGGACEPRLPPGSRGLPLVGETLEFFTASPILELLPFFKRRLERYGPIFRTSLVGEDLIVSLDPELSARVLQQEERAFQIWYPSSFMRVFGADNIITALGPLHRHMRALMLRLFGPERASASSCSAMCSGARAPSCGRGSADRTSRSGRPPPGYVDMIFGVTAKKLISHDDAAAQGSLWKCFDACTRGLLAFPAQHSTRGSEKVMKMLKRQLGERRDAAAERGAVDFFDVVIDELEKPGSEMNESIALDLLFLMLFASHDTTSIGLTAILKFLTDNPEALQELTVIHEALRLAKIAPDTPEPVGCSKDFMAFGGGARLCVGADFAKLQMSIFLHCLLTEYRWKAIGGSTMVFYPGLRFPDGFHIHLLPKD
ncbi:hypothetical protein SETIT_9G149800v2 [Setaria italica]|uniref:Cytochrome P450 n=1 Tax=Setaria italica TaxID=4555 RepID=A0A368SGN3_SETIT|nr:hypothetical protein SETIT_9G149800v2 [Setaria italica]